jgi:hypothetical protein
MPLVKSAGQSEAESEAIFFWRAYILRVAEGLGLYQRRCRLSPSQESMAVLVPGICDSRVVANITMQQIQEEDE